MAMIERKEWTHLWWDDADRDEGLPRVFLVGDSITDGYYNQVISQMQNDCRITVLATSKCVDNPYYLKEFDHVISQYGFRYSVIHFNNGLHNIPLKKEEFALAYETVVKHILEVYPESKLALVLCTPCADAVMHQRAIERNEEIRKIAEKYNLPVDDLFTPMYERPELRCDDGVHYGREGQEVQGKIVGDFIRKLL